MKSFVVYIFLLALVGGGLCAKLRREAPSDAGQSVPADNAADPPAVGAVGAPKVDGLEIAIQALKAKPTPDTDAINKLIFLQELLKDIEADNAAPGAPPAAEA